jgi:hypothetical protein
MMMLCGCCEPQLNERAVKLLLPSAMVSSAQASMPFYRANGQLPRPLQTLLDFGAHTPESNPARGRAALFFAAVARRESVVKLVEGCMSQRQAARLFGGSHRTIGRALA